MKLPSRIVDISMPIDDAVITDPPNMQPKIERFDHAHSVARWQSIYPGLEAKHLPGGLASAMETITLTAHNGTHVDAPYHYHPVDARGRPMPTIDQMPLDWYMRPGVKLDFRRFEDGYVVTAKDVADELARIGHTIEPLDIVLVNTSAGGAYGQPDFNDKGCGMGREATLYLTSRGVRVTGTDAWGWDAPFKHTAERFKRDRDPSIIWEGHFAGIVEPYSHMEKLQNLEALPADGFVVCCFPVKIKGGTAGWTRAVALFD